jgi:hypothetical protein
LPVPELTRDADIKLNKRVSLQRCSATISFADEAQERLPDIVSAVALLVLAAVWLWILFAYADWIFGR